MVLRHVSARATVFLMTVLLSFVLTACSVHYHTGVVNGVKKVYRIDKEGNRILIYEIHRDGRVVAYVKDDPMYLRYLARQRRAEALRKAEELRRAEAERKAEQQRALAERKAEQQRAQAERKLEQQRAQAERKAEQQRAQAERKAEQQRARTERKAEQQRARDERKAGQQRARDERKAEQRARKERKAEQQHARGTKPSEQKKAEVPDTGKPKTGAEHKAEQKHSRGVKSAERKTEVVARNGGKPKTGAERKAGHGKAQAGRKAEQPKAGASRRVEQKKTVTAGNTQAKDNPVLVALVPIELDQALRKDRVFAQIQKEFQSGDGIKLVGEKELKHVVVKSRGYLKEPPGAKGRKGGNKAVVVYEATITSGSGPAYTVSESGSVSQNGQVAKRFADKIKDIIKTRIAPTIPGDKTL